MLNVTRATCRNLQDSVRNAAAGSAVNVQGRKPNSVLVGGFERKGDVKAGAAPPGIAIFLIRRARD
jgi:hypothetical protein